MAGAGEMSFEGLGPMGKSFSFADCKHLRCDFGDRGQHAAIQISPCLETEKPLAGALNAGSSCRLHARRSSAPVTPHSEGYDG
jgi:hypothetical protein